MRFLLTINDVDSQKPTWMEWMWIAVLLIVSIFLFCSSDLCVTSAHGIYLWDSLFSGNFTNLYTDYYNNPNTITAMYDVTLYIVFAIWNIPIYIMHKFGCFFLEDLLTLKTWAMLWNKGLLILFMWLFIHYIDQIAIEYSVEKYGRIWLKYSILSSFLVIYPSFILGQYDLIPVVFTLAGILAYLRNDYRKFLISFILAVGMKFFAIFIFIPLVLIKEKNVFKIGGNCIFAFIIPLFTRIVFRNDAAYSFSKQFSSSKLTLLFERTFPGNFQEFYIIVFLLLGVYIYAYVLKKENYKVFAVYIAMAVFSILFSFMNFGTYWIIMLSPYMLLIGFINFKNQEIFRINILLIALFEGAMFILNLYYHHDNLDYALLERGIFFKIFREKKPNYSFYDLLCNWGYQRFVPCIIALFIVCLVSFLIINFPTEGEYKRESFAISLYNRVIMNLRSLIIFAFISFTLVSYVVPIKYKFNYSDMSYMGETRQIIGGYEVMSGTLIFGPYCNLQKGTYQVKIFGKNLNLEEIDYYIGYDNGQANIDVYDIIRKENYVEYKFILPDHMGDIEFKANINSDQIVFEGLEVSKIGESI